MRAVEVPIEYYICLLEFELAHYENRLKVQHNYTTVLKIASLKRNIQFYKEQANQSASTIVPDLPIVDGNTKQSIAMREENDFLNIDDIDYYQNDYEQ